MDRRSFLRGGLLLVASPAIVRASSLMPVKQHLIRVTGMPSGIYAMEIVDVVSDIRGLLVTLKTANIYGPTVEYSRVQTLLPRGFNLMGTQRY